MKQKLYILLFLFIAFQQLILGQQETYTVTKAPFSSDKYDEYSPVFYRNGIVFTTNRGSGSFVDYSSSKGESTFDIFFIDTTKKATWRKSKVFSKSLKTPLNEGPVTFDSSGDTIYFARNLQIDGNFDELSTARNRLGIFSAVREGEKWAKTRDLRFNNEWYNISTPWLSSDGKRLYFASDKPDGYGGSDLYFCEWKNDYWTDPVNLGPVINTKKNESYPYVNPAGELFFASDGHPGLGGKDIFYSRIKDNGWLVPVRLDSPINSQYDDFGIVTDTLINSGYFSSNRNKSMDIYKFNTNIPQIFYTDIQKENQYCFKFSDSGAIKIDTLNLRYIWDFGDGSKGIGEKVSHCFPGPGKYEVKLDIIDKSSGKLFFSKLAYSLELMDFIQPYIESPDIAVVGEQFDIGALNSYLPGYEIMSYSWDFGSGNRMKGESVKCTFEKSGEYNINLGVKLRSLSTGVIHNTGVTKKILVVSTEAEKNLLNAKKILVKASIPDIRKYENAKISGLYSAEEEYNRDAEFRIELALSKSRITVNNSTFRNLPGKYKVREIFDTGRGLYSYIADRQMTLMETYPAFREIQGSGFKDVVIKLAAVTDPVEKELLNLAWNYGVLSDEYFDDYNRLKSNGYLMLDQIVILMNRNPGIRLELGVHSDNTGIASNNLALSQFRAQIMVNYLIKRGIESKRLVAKGYGGVKPVASNFLERDRRLNRRIEIGIIN